METPPIAWVSPSECEPPHRVTHPNKLEELIADFALSGWNSSCKAIPGYWLDGRIQLIAGSHRWAAALYVGNRIPVVLYTYEYVWRIWGTSAWMKLLETPVAGTEAN